MLCQTATSRWLISSIFLTHDIITQLHDCLNLVIRRVQLSQDGWEFCAAADGLYCLHDVPVRCHERRNCRLRRVWPHPPHPACVEIVEYPSYAVHWPSPQAWWRTTTIFDMESDTMTDLVNVDRMRITDGWMIVSCSCLTYTVDQFANEGWLNCDQVIISMYILF